MTDTPPSEVRADIVRLPGATGGSLWLLRAQGPIDSADHPIVGVALHAPSGTRTVVLDLTLVHLLSARGADGLMRCARALAGTGRTLYLAGVSPAAQRVLDLAGVRDATAAYPTVEEAVAACSPAAAAADHSGGVAPGAGREPGAADSKQVEELRAEVCALRARVRAHPLIDQALGVIRERYRPDGPRAAFDLLRDASQRHNVALRTLAAAVVHDAVLGRDPYEEVAAGERPPAPQLSFLPPEGSGAFHCGTVINAVLRRTLEVTDARMGDVQLADPLLGGMRVEAHLGMHEDCLDVFHSGAEGTPSALAARHGARITVVDVATDPLFGERARAVVLAAGGRGVHSTPLRDGPATVGVVSAYLPRPARVLSSAQARALDEMGAEAGRWLSWHGRTVVRDAVAHLHRRALGRGAVLEER